MDKRTRNVLIAPIALLVRFPLMALLGLVMLIGNTADKLQDWVDRVVPGLRR